LLPTALHTFTATKHHVKKLDNNVPSNQTLIILHKNIFFTQTSSKTHKNTTAFA